MSAPSHSVAAFLPFFKQQNVRLVLDYGAGLLRNTCYLSRNGFLVYALDLPQQIEKIRAMPEAAQAQGLLNSGQLRTSGLVFDLVVSTFVLNIVEDLQDRREILAHICETLRPGGYFLLEVPVHDWPLERNKAFSVPEVEAMLFPLGFIRIGRDFSRSAVSLLYRLKED